MIPHKLVMSAFGPYAEYEEINFDEFEGKGIFLITGETGAGKTTIFDAITYALYGKLTGDREPERFRCDSADADTLTYVELDFTQDGKKYHIRRSPPQMVPRKRGEGFKPELAKVELEYEGMTPLRNNSEIDNKIQEIIGLTYAQWKQVSMLAQGEFKVLLTAKTDERTKTLRSIFSTKSLQDIEGELKDKAKKVKDELIRVEKNIIQTIGQVTLPEDSPYFEGLDSIKNVAYLDELLNTLSLQTALDESEVSSLKEETKLLQDEMSAVSVKIGDAQNVNKEFANLDFQREKLADLKKQEGEILEKEQNIRDTDEAVKEFKVCRNELLTLRKDKDSKQEAIAVKKEDRTRTEGLLNDAIEKKKEAHLKDSDINDLNNTVTLLSPKRETFTQIGEMEVRLKSLGSTKDEKTKTMKDVQKEWDDFVDERAKKREFQKKNDDVDKLLEQKQNELNNLDKEKTDLQAIEKKCKDYILGEKANTTLREKSKTATESVNEAKEIYTDMEGRFFASTVGRLASKLEEGKPCPVCGSLHHDNPAPPHEGAPTEAELEEAKKDWLKKVDLSSSVDKELAESNTKLHSLGGEIKERASIYGFVYDNVPDLQIILAERVITISSQIPDLEKSISGMKELSEQLADTKDYLEKSDKVESELSKKKDDAAKEEQAAIHNYETLEKDILKEKTELGFESLEALNNEIARLTTQKNDLVQTVESCDKAVIDLERELAELNSSVRTMAEDLSKIEASLSSKEKDYSSLLESKGITDKDVAERLEREQSLGIMRDTVQKYRTELVTCQDKIDDLEESTKDKKVVDIEGLKSELNDKTEQYNTKNDEIQSIEVRKATIGGWMTSLRTDKKELEIIEKEGKEIVELSDVFSGNKNMDVRISFETYIQGVFFNKVLSFANNRLMRMTNGRFEMKKRKADDSGNDKKGLDIDVHDNYNGGVRPANSLSGGQSFMASLALALGLSDAVQTMKGGIHIDTLFVDEGFGSLDGATREESVDVLLDLANSNVLVGIISHIPEFKEAFNKQIIVSPVEGRQGESKTKVEIQ